MHDHYDLFIVYEEFKRGPVILVWDAVRCGGIDPRDGRNVVYHEFAHRLDMLDGVTDGTPPLGSEAARRRWVKTSGCCCDPRPWY